VSRSLFCWVVDRVLLCRISDALERHWGRWGKLHCKAASAEVAPELLADQNLHIGLISNHENERVHMRSPDLIRDAPVRGRTILNSVNSPGCVSTRADQFLQCERYC
jgi:hypothetical protein